ncbi:MAG: CotH kinase family protein [Pirellulaceae bacterium]
MKTLLLHNCWLIALALIVTTKSATTSSATELPIAVTPSRGIYREPVTVTITTTDDVSSGSTIYYSTDGTIPTPATGIRYGSPLQVADTTVLRVVAYAADGTKSQCVTTTYLFPEAMLRQEGDDQPRHWGEREGRPVPADYSIDANIVQFSTNRDRLLKSLTELAVVSLVLDPYDLLDSEHGIYANPTERGVTWERPASMEILLPASSDQNGANADKSSEQTKLRNVQADCGLRIQGGWNRRPEESPKHSLRLLFKRRYGPSELNFPLFPADVLPPDASASQQTTTSFDTLILRGGNNNSWLHRGGNERLRADYIRDQWMRDTYASMGHVSARGRYVHVLLNGLYWGVYNLCERPSAPFLATHFGGDKDDYDARNGDKMVDGDDRAWQELMSLVNQGIHSDGEYVAICSRLDIVSFADFMLLNLYGANADYDGASNWYAGRNHKENGPYRFFVWDGERTNEDATNNTIEYDCDQCPARIFQRLRQWPPFRQLFRQRVQLHCTGGGVLTPQAAAERFAFRARQIENAVVAESARWGDYRLIVHQHETGPYLRYSADAHWRVEIDRLMREYFPRRTGILVEQLKKVDLADGL